VKKCFYCGKNLTPSQIIEAREWEDDDGYWIIICKKCWRERKVNNAV